jgi:hypothetical protein
VVHVTPAEVKKRSAVTLSTGGQSYHLVTTGTGNELPEVQELGVKMQCHGIRNKALNSEEITVVHSDSSWCSVFVFFYFILYFSFARQPAVGQGLLIHEVSRIQSMTQHSL